MLRYPNSQTLCFIPKEKWKHRNKLRKTERELFQRHYDKDIQLSVEY